MVGVRVQSLRPFIVYGGLCAALVLSVASPILAAGAGDPGGNAGLSALSAIVDVFRRDGIDPMSVTSPVGVDPLSAATVPEDSEAAVAAAGRQKLMHTVTNEKGVQHEAMVLPQERPQAPGQAARAPATTTAHAKPAKTGPTPLADESEGYRRFMNDVIAISKMRLDDPKNLRRAQAMLTSHNELRLARGWLALCSEIASRSAAFIQGIDQIAQKDGGDQSLEADLNQKPYMVLDVRGWDAASRAVIQEIAHDTAIMQSVADRLTDIAYGRATDEAKLAAEAQSGTLAPSPATAPAASASADKSPISSRARPMMTQILALGARLHLSGESKLAGGSSAMAANQQNDQCLRWADLNFEQCLAAVHDNGERAYCLAKQGIEEREKCWSWIANSGT